MYGWVLGQKCDLWSLVITVGHQVFVSSGERREGEGSGLCTVREGEREDRGDGIRERRGRKEGKRARKREGEGEREGG